MPKERSRSAATRGPVPQGLWAVEAADDGQLLGGATLLPFSPRDPQLVMGWHLRPEARGHGVAGQIGMLWHQAFLTGDVDEVFVATPGTKRRQPRRRQATRNDGRR
jgi:hypothetical protein